MDTSTAILISASGTVLSGLGALFYNLQIGRKHRQIIAVTQLVRDFYHDLEYVKLRIQSYELIKKLSEKECNWNHVVAAIESPDTPPDIANKLVAVNRTAAFYLTVRSLIADKQVDVEMLKNLFGYNYTVYWSEVRKKICEASNNPRHKELFAPINELLIAEKPTVG